ncbi:hypothetical protein GCM10023214_15820 [Amycolatopsis dongchuanensis]|uniref:Uncharacterized protein n=1 Tax=Amycolatopsis dongchuanensis TaxID=1070866 RepID=A0ABP9Q9G7_9PSEU
MARFEAGLVVVPWARFRAGPLVCPRGRFQGGPLICPAGPFKGSGYGCQSVGRRSGPFRALPPPSRLATTKTREISDRRTTGDRPGWGRSADQGKRNSGVTRVIHNNHPYNRRKVLRLGRRNTARFGECEPHAPGRWAVRSFGYPL